MTTAHYPQRYRGLPAHGTCALPALDPLACREASPGRHMRFSPGCWTSRLSDGSYLEQPTEFSCMSAALFTTGRVLGQPSRTHRHFCPPRSGHAAYRLQLVRLQLHVRFMNEGGASTVSLDPQRGRRSGFTALLLLPDSFHCKPGDDIILCTICDLCLNWKNWSRKEEPALQGL